MSLEFPSNPPKNIYLQYYDEGEEYPQSAIEEGAITWCEDKINDSDVEYVRADLVKEYEEEVHKLYFGEREANNNRGGA